MYNPAYTGAAGDPVMKVSAYSFLPGNGYGLNSVYASFDSYFQQLHGGAGIWVVDNMLGDIINEMRAGAGYSYHFRAGRETWISAGLAASVLHRGIRTGSVILPGDLDPFTGYTGFSSETIEGGNITIFDLATGITAAGDNWYGGLSVAHLTQPWLTRDQESSDRLRRLYTLTGGMSFELTDDGMILNPSASLMVQDDILTGRLGAELLFRQLMFGMAFWKVSSGFTAIEPSAGWDAGYVKIIMSYSYDLGRSPVSAGGTAVVRAGLSVYFNNVEKSRALHVIKLPEL